MALLGKELRSSHCCVVYINVSLQDILLFRQMNMCRNLYCVLDKGYFHNCGNVFWTRSERMLTITWCMFYIWFVVSDNRINTPILRTSRNYTDTKTGKHGGNKIHTVSAFKTRGTPRLTCVHSAALPCLCIHNEDSPRNVLVWLS